MLYNQPSRIDFGKRVSIRNLKEIPTPQLRKERWGEEYGDVKYRYSTTYTQQLAYAANPSHTKTYYYRDYLRDMDIMEHELAYDGVNPDRENVWKSVNRMFTKPKVSYIPKDFKRAKRIIKDVLGPFFRDGLQYSPEITPEAVPGCWWKYYGFKTKDEVLRHPLFWKSHMETRAGHRKYAPYSCSGKREFLKKTELSEKKIRTFLIAPLELLLDEKFLYGTQDKNMKNYQPGWIRYGLDMHNGGFDRFIKGLISDFHVEWDISGWDRLLSILKDVMELRNECLEEALGPSTWEQIRPIAERVTEAVVNHELLLPNGDVVQWDWSQMSGDGMTTSNNCIAHAIIFAYLLIQACPEATDDEIKKQLGNLYGDDVLAGLQNKFSRVKDEDFVNSIYGQFGMSVKKGTFKCQDSPVGMSFLGATTRVFYHRKKPYFAPSYSRDRIITGHACSLDPLDLDSELMKQYSLLELGWYDCYDEISKYIVYLLKRPEHSSVLTAFRSVGIPSREALRNRWAGLSDSS